MQHAFTSAELQQIKAHGLTVGEAENQVALLKKGNSFIQLVRACTLGDGIDTIATAEFGRLTRCFNEAVAAHRVAKFVPASGAASRMFQPLLAVYHHYEDYAALLTETQSAVNAHVCFTREFLQNLHRFAFYSDLCAVLANAGLDAQALISRQQYKPILEYTLTAIGLNYAELPKGLIQFHCYAAGNRSAFEEQLVEAVAYADGRVHFTITPDQHNQIDAHLKRVRARLKKSVADFDISYSYQKLSTDTLAVTEQNALFHDRFGNLVFRPGGHGALLANLADLQGDIVFIKNIDNVAPDHLKADTYRYKCLLGGYLLDLQAHIFDYLRRLTDGERDASFLAETTQFARQALHITLTAENNEALMAELYAKLNRPLRVCGMVKNQGEPGGGPFWIRRENAQISLQIVEKSEVRAGDPEQLRILDSATHFNPVDLVCGLRNYRGQLFDLQQFVDPSAVFVSTKSYENRTLKALELPGLWNGAMAYWNTIFVEVPLSTFTPVKTVNDLLRPEHQALGTS